MKHTLIITALMLIVGCSQKMAPFIEEPVEKPIDGSTLVRKDGLFYAPDSEEPYNGDAVWYYDNGQIHSELRFKDGELIESTRWGEDGNKLKVSISAEEVIGNIPDIATLTEFGLTAKSLLSQAEQLRDHQKYLDAIEKLEVLLESFPYSPEAPDAQVLVAQIYMGYQNDFSSAVREFRKVVTKFPKSVQAHNAQFMMGYIYANHLYEKEKARSEFQKFIDLYSGEVEEYFLESARAELRSLEEGPPELNVISE